MKIIYDNAQFLELVSELNAMVDVKILSKLASHTKMNANELRTPSFSQTALQNQLRDNIEKAKNLTLLHSLVGKCVLKMGIAKKVAGSGLNLGHLNEIFERDEEDGLRNTFSCKN